VQAIEQQLPPALGELRARAADARRLAARTVAQLRELAQLLRPSVLDDYGLMPSLQTCLKDFQERHGVTATLSSEGVPERLPALGGSVTTASRAGTSLVVQLPLRGDRAA